MKRYSANTQINPTLFKHTLDGQTEKTMTSRLNGIAHHQIQVITKRKPLIT